MIEIINSFYSKYSKLIVALIIIIIMYVFLYSALHQRILSHNHYDSYTLQAMSWWKGQTYLDKNYEHLELAFYEDRVYVSFPPFPSVIHFFLVPFFKENTPNNLLTTVYTIISFIVVYLLCKRKTDNDWSALFWAAFVVFGSNLLAISVFGGVWFDAQALNFLLTLLSIYFVTSVKPKHWYIGLIFYAFAIGCRPFQIVYLPLYVWLIYKNIRSHNSEESNDISTSSAIRKASYYFLPFVVIGLIFAVYNFVRFDNPIEFGHNYLPEFIEAENGQFHLQYIAENWRNLFRLPEFKHDFSLTFPKFNGFAFYIANPLFIVMLIYLIRSQLKGLNWSALAIPALILLHILVTLSHKTLGGWQFGIRYFIDMLPFVFLYIYSSDQQLKVHNYQLILMAFAVMINLYGTLWFYLNW